MSLSNILTILLKYPLSAKPLSAVLTLFRGVYCNVSDKLMLVTVLTNVGRGNKELQNSQRSSAKGVKEREEAVVETTLPVSYRAL